MKPLTTLLVLLFVLIIILVFRKYYSFQVLPKKNEEEEGFVSFANDSNNASTVYIPLYSLKNDSNVYKLYDSIFYDINNGYIIEVDGDTYTNKVDSKGTTINGIYVISREGKFTSKKDDGMYKNTLSCKEGDDTKTYTGSVSVLDEGIRANCSAVSASATTITTLTTKYQNWQYTTKSINTNKYSIIYVSYDILTFIHIIDNTSLKHKITYSFIGSQTKYSKLFESTDSVVVSTVKDNKNINNDSYVIDTSYDSKIKVYQFTDTVKFDDNNGYLIVTNASDGSVTVYNRVGVKQKDFKNSIPVDMVSTSNTFNPWVVSDGNNSQILYIQLGKITVLIEIIYDSTNKIFKSRNVFITGSYNNDIIVTNNISSSTSGKTDMDKYILKTEIVPPVCPSCPNCPCYDGVCNDCGGNGGEGTYDRSEKIKNKLKNFFKNGRHTDAEEADQELESNKRHKKIRNFFNEGVHTDAEEAKRDAESNKRHKKIRKFFKEGAHDDYYDDDYYDDDYYIKGNLHSYSSNIHRDSLDKIYDKDIDLEHRRKDTDDWWSKNTNKHYSSSQYRPSERELKEQNENIRNTYNISHLPPKSTVPGVDMYSYFGALVPKGGYNNYMPITADFSSFGL